MLDHELRTVSWSLPAQENSFEQLNSAGHFQFEIGGVSVNLSGAGLANGLDPALRPFCVAESVPDIRLKVICLPRLDTISGPPLFDSGTTWRLYECQEGFRFDFSAPVFGRHPYRRLTTDRHFLYATLELSAELFSGFPFFVSPLEYPLDELLIMHRLTQEKAIELHGSGIVRADGIGNLFVGHSGAGKSTTTRLWTGVEDVEVLSDDRIIVRRDESVVETPCGTPGSASKHGVLRLRDCSASRSNLSAQDDKGKGAADCGKYSMRMYGTPWHGEAMYASPNSALLARVFVLEHGHGNVITPLTPSQAVAELFARSFVPFHRHEYVDSALVFLEELANAVPVYRYAFEPDQRAVEKIRNFHD